MFVISNLKAKFAFFFQKQKFIDYKNVFIYYLTPIISRKRTLLKTYRTLPKENECWNYPSISFVGYLQMILVSLRTFFNFLNFFNFSNFFNYANFFNFANF